MSKTTKKRTQNNKKNKKTTSNVKYDVVLNVILADFIS